MTKEIVHKKHSAEIQKENNSNPPRNLVNELKLSIAWILSFIIFLFLIVSLSAGDLIGTGLYILIIILLWPPAVEKIKEKYNFQLGFMPKLIIVLFLFIFAVTSLGLNSLNYPTDLPKENNNTIAQSSAINTQDFLGPTNNTLQTIDSAHLESVHFFSGVSISSILNDTSNNFLLIGHTTSGFEIKNLQVLPKSKSDSFILKLTNDLDTQWVKYISGLGNNIVG